MIIDLILPPGRHSWNLDEGWAYNLKHLGMLGQIKQASPNNADEILDYVCSSTANMILLMGADHHLHFLHDTAKKRQRWTRLKVPVVCFCYESILDSRFAGSLEKSKSATDAFSHFVHCDEKDASFFEERKAAAIWLPQCVDHHHFHPPPMGTARESRVYFRGKLDERYGYDERRAILDLLRNEKLLATRDSEIPPAELMEDYRKYAFAINLPGNFGGYNVRTFEALASGCLLFQYLPKERSQNNALFMDEGHLLAFDTEHPRTLASLVRKMRENPERAARIAEAGRRECLAKHTIEVRIRQVVDFVTASYHQSDRLHIGCGDNVLRGFCNVDCRSLNPSVVVDDAGKLSRIKDSSYELIYACHVLEHFSYHTVKSVLQNWVGKLKPNGLIYLSVPNFRYLAWRYLWKRKMEDILPPLFGGQEYAENFHYIAFDKRTLSTLMREVGLVDVAPFKAKEFEFTSNDCSRWPLSLNLVGRRPATA